MENERLAREKEEEAKKAKAAKIKEEFGDAGSEWEQDKQEMLALEAKEQEAAAQGAAQGAAQKAAAAAGQAKANKASEKDTEGEGPKKKAPVKKPAAV
jgi:mannan polymerase II complex ANP1 subunit